METRLRLAERYWGDNGRPYAEQSLLSANDFKEKIPRRLGGETLVAMMQAADLWESDDLARIRRMNRTRFRTVLI